MSAGQLYVTRARNIAPCRATLPRRAAPFAEEIGMPLMDAGRQEWDAGSWARGAACRWKILLHQRRCCCTLLLLPLLLLPQCGRPMA
jgi:hypothetical protein